MSTLNRRINPGLYSTDQCLRYIPRHNYDTFAQQIQMTDGQLLNFLPPTLLSMHRKFHTTNNIITVCFVALNVAIITGAHKIKWLERFVGNRWAMLAVKGLTVGGLFFGYWELEAKALREHYIRVYKWVEDDYRKYKNTGDIREFNPQVKVFQIQWPSANHQKLEQSGRQLHEFNKK